VPLCDDVNFNKFLPPCLRVGSYRKKLPTLGQITDRIASSKTKTEDGILPAFGGQKTNEETKNDMKTFFFSITAIIHKICIYTLGRGEHSGDVDFEPETEAA
jgi:hypothetical protein